MLICAACGPSAEDIVAEAGAARITLGTAQKFTDGLDSALHSKKSGMAARREYVESLILEEVLVVEARARGMHENAEFQEDAERRFRKRATNAYHRDRLMPALQITDQDIRAQFLLLEYDKGKELSRLLVRTLEEAQLLHSRLASGARFDSLAQIHSLDQKSAPRGGLVGVLNWGDAEKVGVPRHVFAALAPGAVSEPLETSDGYMLVYCSALAEPDIGRYYDQIGRKLKRDRFLQANAALIDSLVATMNLTLQSEGMRTLAAMRAEGVPTGEERARPLYTYAGGEITVGDFAKAVERREGPSPYGDSTIVVRTAENFIIPRVLLWEEARNVGYADTDEILAWKARKTRDLLIRALRKEVADQIAISEEEVSRYYDSRGEELRSAKTWQIDEILLETEPEAEQVRARLGTGETFASLAVLTRRHGAVESHAEIHMHSFETPVYGEAMMKAVAGASPGELIGPLQVKGGFSVFRLNDMGGGELPTRADADGRIRGILTVVKREALFNEYLDGILRKYAARIRIDEEVLARLVLPGEE